MAIRVVYKRHGVLTGKTDTSPYVPYVVSDEKVYENAEYAAKSADGTLVIHRPGNSASIATYAAGTWEFAEVIE